MDWFNALENPEECRDLEGYERLDNSGHYLKDGKQVVRTPEGVAKNFPIRNHNPTPKPIEIRVSLGSEEPGTSCVGRVRRYQILEEEGGSHYTFPEVYSTEFPNKLSGANVLMEDLEGERFSDLDAEQRRDLGEDLGNVFSEMHSKGISVRDWKAANIIVMDYDEPEFGFVDLEYATDSVSYFGKKLDCLCYLSVDEFPTGEIFKGYRS